MSTQKFCHYCVECKKGTYLCKVATMVIGYTAVCIAAYLSLPTVFQILAPSVHIDNMLRAALSAASGMPVPMAVLMVCRQQCRECPYGRQKT